MSQQIMKEKWPGTINVVRIGATPEEGGSTKRTVTIGGQNTLPFLTEEGLMPHKPVVAFEVWDTQPVDWPEELSAVYGNVLKDPLAWAKLCVEEYQAELLCVRLAAAHPDTLDYPAEKEADFLSKLSSQVDVLLIVIGCGDIAKDNLVLPVCSQALKGQRCLLGNVLQDNYKPITAACIADGHNIIAESPIDINIAKQLNILISDMGMPIERIVINPTIGALGYGLEYAYSIMERARLAALSADKMLSMPFICFVAQEAWRAKEAKVPQEEMPEWGSAKERGIIWEAMTAAALLQAGADILVMRHPKAIETVRKLIADLMAG